MSCRNQMGQMVDRGIFQALQRNFALTALVAVQLTTDVLISPPHLTRQWKNKL